MKEGHNGKPCICLSVSVCLSPSLSDSLVRPSVHLSKAYVISYSDNVIHVIKLVTTFVYFVATSCFQC